MSYETAITKKKIVPQNKTYLTSGKIMKYNWNEYILPSGTIFSQNYIVLLLTCSSCFRNSNGMLSKRSEPSPPGRKGLHPMRMVSVLAVSKWGCSGLSAAWRAEVEGTDETGLPPACHTHQAEVVAPRLQAVTNNWVRCSELFFALLNFAFQDFLPSRCCNRSLMPDFNICSMGFSGEKSISTLSLCRIACKSNVIWRLMPLL